MLRQRFQKILAVILTLVLLATLLPVAPVFAADTQIIYENNFEAVSTAVDIGGNKALEFNAAGDISNGWLSVFQQELVFSYTDKINSGATLSFDLFLPATATYSGLLKAQAVTKMGESWTWTQASAIPEIAIGDFGDSVNGYKKAQVSITFGTEIEAVQGLKAIIPCLAESNCNYNGLIYLDNVKLINGLAVSVEPVMTTIYENDFNSDATAVFVTTTDKALEFVVAGDVSNSWNSIFQKELAFEYADNINSGATMSFDLLLPEAAVYTGSLKAQAVVKMGDDWVWTQASAIPEILISNFTDQGNGFKKATVSISFGTEIETEQGLKVIIPCLAASNCDYSGNIYLDNVKFENAAPQGEPELPAVDPIKYTFDSADSIASWSDDGSYQYSGGLTINYDVDFAAMKLNVDYSGDSSTSWSEAKVKYTFAQAQEFEGYNQFSFDFIYDPAKMTKGTFLAKLFSGTIDINTAISNAEDFGSGLKKAAVVLSLTGAANSVNSFTIGLVGNSTDYKGSVYIDNVTFSQVVEDDIYVTATLSPEAQTPVQVNSNSVVACGQTQATLSNIKLADDNAMNYTVKLAAYLDAIGKTDSVLFGHQNDITHKSGSAEAPLSNSDTKDMTGSIAAVMGIDALSLTGNELEAAAWNDTLANRVAAVEAVTKEAAGQGAIVTLSAHMPNFEIIDQRVKNSQAGTADPSDSGSVGILSDGHYNFSGYTPGTLTGDIVKRIMPGQDLNYLYTDYLDMIAAYGKSLEDDNISVMFRPFHEGTGSWFWWGRAFCDQESYKNIYKYTVEYLRDVKGVHNFLYVYGPSSDAESTADYALRYPGDDYVDMVGFDMYHQNPAAGDNFIAQLTTEMGIVQQFATEHSKLFAVTETGVANPNSQAFLKTGNERKDWFNEVLDAVAPTNASYFMVWANFGENTSFYTPYVISKTATAVKGQEMIDNFIDYYNDPRSVFASQMGDISQISATAIENTNVTGYITAPVSGSRILDTAVLAASVKNAAENSVVKFTAKNKAGDKVQEIPATEDADGIYKGTLTADKLALLGASAGTMSLVVDGTVYNTINLKYNMPEPAVDPMVVDTFENYDGDDAILNTSWSTGKGTGCSITPALSGKSYEGNYSMMFSYSLISGGYVGVTKSMNGADWSAANALHMWTVPDGKKQKVVVQITSGTNVFEVYLNQYAAYNDSKNPVLATIPFSSFAGRDNAAAVFDPGNIQSFGLWCNTIVPEGEDSATYTLDSVLYYDDIKAVTSTAAAITFTEVLSDGGVTGDTGTNTGVTSNTGSSPVTDLTPTEQDIRKILDSSSPNPVLTVTSNSEVVNCEFSGQMIQQLEGKEAILEVKTANATYTLPAQQININDISKQFGQDVNLKDIQVKITISKPSDETAKLVENAAKAGEFSIVIPPIEFAVQCTYKGKIVEVTGFEAYVERTVAIPDGVDPSKVTTAIVVDRDGTVRQVPTKIVVINGKSYAVINSLTNSVYVLISHPVTFVDITNHWAKKAIEDMSSRMIFDKVGDSRFQPDKDITRGEFTAIMVKALGLKTGTAGNLFKDVGVNVRYSGYIKTAVDYKLITGYGDGRFGVMDKVTREQAMTVIANAMKITGLKADLENGEAEKLLAAFTDSDKTAAWAKESVASCIKTGLVQGSKAGLAPKNNITRAELAEIIMKLLQKSNLI
jgi:mannan endo-1,4-beta-mannosidase